MKHKLKTLWHKISYRFMSVYMGFLTAVCFIGTFPRILFVFSDEYRSGGIISAIVQTIVESPIQTLAVNIPMLLALGYTTKVLWKSSTRIKQSEPEEHQTK